MPLAIEDVLLRACKEKEPPVIPETITTTLYEGDIDMARLSRQLGMLPDLISASNLQAVTSVRSVANTLSTLPPGLLPTFAEVDKMVRIYLTIPVTTATGERSFSCLRRIKTYLRTTMTQQRLNNAMLCYAHKEKTDELCLPELAISFVRQNDRRRSFFGNPEHHE